MSNNPPESTQYPTLEQDIHDLKDFADAIDRETVGESILELVQQIKALMNPDHISSLQAKEIRTLRDQVEALSRKLDDISYDYISQIIAESEPSEVFRVLSEANRFEQELRKALGKSFEYKGRKVEVTPAIVEALTRYRFSLGHPPVTPRAIQVIEQIMFGGELTDIYGFRDLLGTDRDVFDRFLSTVDQLIEQSTHYTTNGELDAFETEARNFVNLEGTKGIAKAVISGPPETAVRLIREHLFKYHGNGSVPIREVREESGLDNALMEKMRKDKKKVFLVRVKGVDATNLSKVLAHEKWDGLLGRLVLIDSSKNASRSVTSVYTLHPKMKRNLEAFHVQDMGRPANTQMNLRRILENFKGGDLHKLKTDVGRKIAGLEAAGIFNPPVDQVRKQEWIVSAQRDFLALKRFKDFLDLIVRIKEGSNEDFTALNRGLRGDTEELARKYFFKELPKKGDGGYECISVPEGGGRKELGHIAKFQSARIASTVSGFKSTKLEMCKAKLKKLKSDMGVDSDTSQDEAEALKRAMSLRGSPNTVLHGDLGAPSRVDALAKDLTYRFAERFGTVLDSAQEGVDAMGSANPTGRAHARLSESLGRHGMGAFAKKFERDWFAKAADGIRSVQGTVARRATDIADVAGEAASRARLKQSTRSFTFVEELLQQIEDGTFKPSLALGEIGWSFKDVFVPDDFPEENYLKIPLNGEKVMSPDFLRTHLEKIREQLQEFPELFELYCSSMILIINDPHNPTGKVLPNAVKLKFLDLASKYPIVIVSDEAYLKQVKGNIKKEQGYPSLACFCEKQGRRYAGRKPIIYTSNPHTKWAVRGGGRTGVITTNDTGKHSLVSDEGRAAGNSLKALIAQFQAGESNIEAIKAAAGILSQSTVGVHARLISRSAARLGRSHEEGEAAAMKEDLRLLMEATEAALEPVDFRTFVEKNTDGSNSGSLYMDNATYRTGLAAKATCKSLEAAFGLGHRGTEPEVIVDALLEKMAGEIKEAASQGQEAIYLALLQARNDLDLLKIRGATPLDRWQYISQLISNIKDYRLEKLTQKDVEARTKQVEAAIDTLAESGGGLFSGLKERCTMPEGPFYMCLQLDPSGTDQALSPFLQRLARTRHIEAVPVGKGYVRFAFGAYIDGTEDGYGMLKEAIQTEVSLLLSYWNLFKKKESEISNQLAASGSEEGKDPIKEALKEVLSLAAEEVIGGTILAKGDFVKRFGAVKSPKRRKLVQPFNPDLAPFLSKIEPSSKSTILTLGGIPDFTESNGPNDKRTPLQRFAEHPVAQNIFNHFLTEVINEVKGLQALPKNSAVLEAEYGMHAFAEKIRTRTFHDEEAKIFGEIAMAVAKKFFSMDLIKILRMEFEADVSKDVQELAILGTQERLSRYISDFLDVFITPEQKASLDIQASIQAGYPVMKGLEAAGDCPLFLRHLISNLEFAGKPVATDKSPNMRTENTVRVAGNDRAIARRDGDGVSAPKAEFFRTRLSEFTETMDPKEYVAKMAQIGPTQILMVMHRSYTHYMAEELRLFPQYEISFDDLGKVRPDAVSFMGLPTKVMGEDFRIGYYFDQFQGSDTTIPISWVDRENVTDYMGYLKKPVLTTGNERVKETGGFPIHGSAVTITFKNGLRKTTVLAGDSGVGKSESLIAMAEQIMNAHGGAAEVEGLEFLSGDMLSLWEGEDDQVYMIGTEEGDFMRMTDIPAQWKTSARDLINNANRTNNYPGTKNPRYTISGLCPPKTFLQPTRVNVFAYTNNFQIPDGAAFQPEESPAKLLKGHYVNGYRREKGTSGDQPNLFASGTFSEGHGREEVFTRYGKDLDTHIAWRVVKDDRGKAVNGFLKFSDLPDKVFEANNMVRDLFVGAQVLGNIKAKDKKAWLIRPKVGEAASTWTVKSTRLCASDPQAQRENLYLAKLERHYTNAAGESLSEEKEVPIDRAIFDQVYKNPIASTYCGNPFVGPRGMSEVLNHFGDLFKTAGVKTGVLYTQLAVPGLQFSGPTAASQDIIKFLQKDPEINARFQKHIDIVEKTLLAKYGPEILGAGHLPKLIQAHNLLGLEAHTSNTVAMVRRKADGTMERILGLKTPEYQFDPNAIGKEFEPSILIPEIRKAIEDICGRKKHQSINLESFSPELTQYEVIKDWNRDKAELIYQVLLLQGNATLGEPAKNFVSQPDTIKKAERIVELMKESKLAPS